MSIVNLNKTRTPTIVALTPNEKINGWFIGPDFIIGGLVSDVSLSADEWTHLTAVMDTSVGFTWYINGIKDNFYDLTRKTGTATTRYRLSYCFHRCKKYRFTLSRKCSTG